MIETPSDFLRSSSAKKCLETFVWPSEQFWKSSESDRKSSENRQKRHVYIIKSILHVSSKI